MDHALAHAPEWIVRIAGAAAATLAAAAAAGTVCARQPASAALLVAALTAAAADLRCGLIPDALTFPSALIVAALRADALPDALGGAAIACGVLALPWAVTRGRGFGLGDVKFGLVIGAALGPLGGLAAIAAAFICGGIAGAALLIARRCARGAALPFAPFLAAGVCAIACVHVR